LETLSRSAAAHRSKIGCCFLAAAALAPTPAIFAQNAPATASVASAITGKAHIAGVVIDSLHSRYLSGANVVIDGINITLQTDSVGRFEIDTLPPGTYQVGVFHAVLDTLGTAIATRPFRIGPDSATYMVLAVPSATTIVSRICGGTVDMGTSAVIGHVEDPETLQPVANAEVSVAWTDLLLSKEVGIRRAPRLIRDTTDSSGAFTICGLPSSMQATLQARHGAVATAEIPIALGDRPVELVSREILLTAADSAAKSGTATVSGVVRLEGMPVGSPSRVELVGTNRVALTNEKGEFKMDNLPPGSSLLLARHLGFGAEVVPVDLSSHQAKKVTITLAKYVSVMDPVVVTARRIAALDKTGFGQRSRTGMGYYLGPERVARMHAVYVSDILRQVPSLRTIPGRYGNIVVPARAGGGACIQYYVDGMLYPEGRPGDVNQFLNGVEVAAVEVYQPEATPGQFMTGAPCITVVLWTNVKAGN
jgi:Carboxypeptidase regulatory-like domain